MRKIIICLYIIIFLTACSLNQNRLNKNIKENNTAENINDDTMLNILLSEINVRDIHDYYFPTNSFKFDQFTQSWYGGFLDVLDNVNLVNITGKNAIRFLCLRTFHKPFSIKIIWGKDDYPLLEFNLSNGSGGYSFGNIIKNTKKNVNSESINELLKMLDNNNFYNQPTIGSMPEGIISFDGSNWIIEVNINGNYHVLERGTGTIGRNVANEIGNYLIELSGEEIEDMY